MDQFPDLMTVLVNISGHIPAIISMMQGIVQLIALYFVGHALFEIWAVSYDNASKYVSGSQSFSYSSAVMQFCIGAILFSMSDLEMVGIMSRTVTGDFVSSRFIAYGVEDASYSAQVEAATRALLGVLQIVGFSAMCKGWFTLNRIFNAQTQTPMTTAFGWLIGGIAAWNFQWVAEVLNNSTGFNFITLFPGA